MKILKLLVFVIIIISALSCKSSTVDFTKTPIEQIVLYDYNNQLISVEAIKNLWQERITTDEGIDAKITDLKIAKVKDIETNKHQLVLLAHTSANSIKTASKLFNYKNGLKLDNITVTCKSCYHQTLNIQLRENDWSCISKDNACTKTETMTTK